MYLSGVSLHVLADHFIIHQNHLYEEMARKNEVRNIFQAALYFSRHLQRRYNRKVYSDFKEELCFRYLNIDLLLFR